MNLFKELRRRNMFRVAAGYAVVAWLLAQAAGVLEASLGLPVWFDSFVVASLLIGFPVALLLAWAFEVTPEGVRRAGPTGDAPAEKNRLVDVAILGGLALVAVLVILRPGAAPVRSPLSTQSVAVLPFADLSRAGDQAYFADGLSEEILNVLVRVPGLQVAGRTSSFSFRGEETGLKEIGSALGVAHVLEGSLRRDGDRLRITAQLVRTADGFQLWSETYDRRMADVFAVQDDIAAEVAEELALSLGLAEREEAPTRDLAAYDAFLEARALYLLRGEANLRRAQKLLTGAVARDPGYAEGWAQLAAVSAVLPFYTPDGPETVTTDLAVSEAAARRAIALDERNALAHATVGTALAGRRDYVGAFAAFDTALALAPNDPSVADTFAQHALQVGYQKEAEAAARRAVATDPLNALFLNTLGWSLAAQGKWEDAIGVYERAVAADPTLGFPWGNGHRVFIAAGDRVGARAWIDRAAELGDTVPGGAEFAALARAAMDAAWTDPPPDTLPPEAASYDANAFAVGSDQVEQALPSLRASWQNDQDGLELTLFWVVDSRKREVLSDPVWRARVREKGLLALWRARGFPSFCRPVGADDFACAEPEAGS